MKKVIFLFILFGITHLVIAQDKCNCFGVHPHECDDTCRYIMNYNKNVLKEALMKNYQITDSNKAYEIIRDISDSVMDRLNKYYKIDSIYIH